MPSKSDLTFCWYQICKYVDLITSSPHSKTFIHFFVNTKWWWQGWQNFKHISSVMCYSNVFKHLQDLQSGCTTFIRTFATYRECVFLKWYANLLSHISNMKEWKPSKLISITWRSDSLGLTKAFAAGKSDSAITWLCWKFFNK